MKHKIMVENRQMVNNLEFTRKKNKQLQAKVQKIAPTHVYLK